MDENNFINQNENNEEVIVENVSETANTAESITEESVAQDEIKAEATEETAFEENDYIKNFNSFVPVIEVDSVDRSDPESKKGLKLFALALSFVLVLCCGITAGYFFGNSTRVNNIGSSVSVDLSSKPENKDMLTAAEVYDKANASVVGILTYNSSSMSSASGVVYTEDGYIITNDHIYDGIGAARFKVFTSDGNEYSAEYVAGDARSDIAVIKVTDKVKLTPAQFGNPDELYIGEPVVAIGRPTGAETANNLTGGYVSLMGRRANVASSYSMKYIQTDTAINPGSSGGALLNMYSQVVGITSSKIAGEEYEGMGFAVPMTIVKQVADSLIANGYVEGRAKLGISYREIDSVTAEVYDMTEGLNIASVDESSDLYGKISEGDTIVSVNGNEITSADVILEAIENSKPGDTLSLLVVTEKGANKTVSAKLLPDKGSSSYTKHETVEEDTSSAPNTSEFNFPFGD